MVWRTCGRLQADMKSPRFRHRVDRSKTLRSVLTAAALQSHLSERPNPCLGCYGQTQVAQIDSRFALPMMFSSVPTGDLLARVESWRSAAMGRSERHRTAVIKTSGRLPHAVFSPDGDLVLTATNDNAARLLKTDGTEFKVLAGHQNRIMRRHLAQMACWLLPVRSTAPPASGPSRTETPSQR